MDLDDILYGVERDRVAGASALTYNPTQLQQLNLQIDVNTSTQKVRWVGNENNPIYPQIVVWRPNYPGSSAGNAVVVEMIETVGTLGTPNIQKWRRLASIAGIHFNLIVPHGNLVQVRQLLRDNNITTGVNLQTYSHDASTDRYTFYTPTGG